MSEKLVKFYCKGHWLFGKLNTETQEITLPSGYKLPVENGMVYYLGEWCEVLDV